MQVRVTADGAGLVLNGPGHKALPAAAEGDVIDVQGGPYGLSLLEAGLVERYDGPAPVAAAEPGPSEAPVAGPRKPALPKRPTEPKGKKLTEISKLADLQAEPGPATPAAEE